MMKRRVDQGGRKYKDRRVIGKVAPIIGGVPESVQYRDLKFLERKLDTVIAAKQLKFQDALSYSSKVSKKLRLFISNTLDSTAPTTAESVPVWGLRVEGRLMDQDEFGNLSKLNDQRYRRKMSAFIERIFVQLADGTTFEWNDPQEDGPGGGPVSDGFELSHDGVGLCSAVILITMKHDPAKHKLTRGLARLIGLHTGTEAQAVEAVWRYIKLKALQDPDDPELINMDPCMASVFSPAGLEITKMSMWDIPQRLKQLLLPADPVTIEFKFDPRIPRRDVYDIEVELDDVIRVAVNNFAMPQQAARDLVSIEQKIDAISKDVADTRRKRAFLSSFSRDPKEFLHSWIASQAADADEELHASGLTEEQRHAEYFRSGTAEEAIFRYNSKMLSSIREDLQKTLAAKP
eukprot:m.417162 g.417162  ORF g.417162 m.417162 type:complete len:404 (-) comp30311_c0_seq1:159-1370(-)